MSAILAAFLIEIRKGLQEDLLLRILRELEHSSQSPYFRPRPVSVWVNALWFSSLISSLMGALGILGAKVMASRFVVDPEGFKPFILPLDRIDISRNAVVRGQLLPMLLGAPMFKCKYQWYIIAIFGFIYLAVVLFLSSLITLLLTDQRHIGVAALVLTAVPCSFFVGSGVLDFLEVRRLKIIGISNICQTIIVLQLIHFLRIQDCRKEFMMLYAELWYLESSCLCVSQIFLFPSFSLSFLITTQIPHAHHSLTSMFPSFLNVPSYVSSPCLPSFSPLYKLL